MAEGDVKCPECGGELDLSFADPVLVYGEWEQVALYECVPCKKQWTGDKVVPPCTEESCPV